MQKINHLTDKEQAKAIVKNINNISQEYSEVQSEDIDVPSILPGTIPQFTPHEIESSRDKIKQSKLHCQETSLQGLKKNSSVILCVPMAHMINHSIKTGTRPDSYCFQTLRKDLGRPWKCHAARRGGPGPQFPTRPHMAR